MNEETQVYFIDSDVLPEKALARKHMLEQDPSSRTDPMKYMPGMEVLESDVKDKVLEQMNELAIDRNVNLQGLEETTVFQLKVQKPSDDAVLSNDTVTVTVEIEKDEA